MAVAAAACDAKATKSSVSTSPESTGSRGPTAVRSETPAETGGPFPADGSNENGSGEISNLLVDQRTMRSDIRADLDGSNVQEGVATTLAMKVIDQATGAAMVGAVVYVWHCNKFGDYSAYNSELLSADFSANSFLRGAQVCDEHGQVAFETVLPGRYSGRAFHFHFEVFNDASFGRVLLTSQLGLDDEVLTRVYAESDYDDALANDTRNEDDGEFGDGFDHQLATLSGTVGTRLRLDFEMVV